MVDGAQRVFGKLGEVRAVGHPGGRSAEPALSVKRVLLASAKGGTNDVRG